MKYDELTNQQAMYVDAIAQWSDDMKHADDKEVYSRAELRMISLGIKGSKWIPNWITHDQSRRIDRGRFSLPEVVEKRQQNVVTDAAESEGTPVPVTMGVA
tara:strand:+ start:331 stop:633 length:303 start_codon:yes stop_codon:yes gene_type:complete